MRLNGLALILFFLFEWFSQLKEMEMVMGKRRERLVTKCLDGLNFFAVV